VAEPNEVFFVNLSVPVNAMIADGQGSGTIMNDDDCPVVTPGVADGTFEAGDPWPAWTVKTSFNFGTPLCSTAICPTGRPPFAGSNWAWFGRGVVAGTEDSTLGQTVTLPISNVLTLRFQMRVTNLSPNRVHTLVVSVDGTTVQTFTEPAAAESAYSPRQIDLASFGDGGPHALLFAYDGPDANNASFLVDNVELLACSPPPPSLSINDVVVPEGNSGTTTARFTATLSQPSAQTVTVAYATGNGTATAGSDYVAASGTVTFPPGTTTQPIGVTLNGDTFNEPTETFFLTLSSATNATISGGQGVVTINNDDDLPPSLSIDDVTAPENLSATFTVTLSAASGQAVTVAYTAADGTAVAPSDYTATSGTLTLPPGVTTQLITVKVMNDGAAEPDEVFFVNLGSPVNATIADGQGVAKVTGPQSTEFYTLVPCRLVDTRNPVGPSGGPGLAANTTRDFPATGLCGVPSDAKAVAVNFTVTGETEGGHLRLFPAGTAEPLVSAINFTANVTRANNGVFGVGTNGRISVRCNMSLGSPGGTQFILDAVGYFK
jgi:hypothetical protein